MMSIRTLSIIFIALTLAIPADAQEKAVGDPAKIKELIAALGDDDPQTRESAQKGLIELGKASEAVFPALQATLKASEDAEVKHRIEAIIKEIGDPEAKKDVLKSLDALSKSKGYSFTCRVESSPHATIAFGGGGAIERKNVLSVEGIYRSTGISSMKMITDDNMGWNRSQFDIYQVGGQSVFRKGDAPLGAGVVVISMTQGQSPEEILRLDDSSWRLVEKGLVSHFLSAMTNDILTKAVAMATRTADEKIGDTSCNAFEVTLDQKGATKILGFCSKGTKITDIQCRIVVDPERILPRRIALEARQGSEAEALAGREKKPFALQWTFVDQDLKEKVEMPEEVKRLFLGDPAVRKILGSE